MGGSGDERWAEFEAGSGVGLDEQEGTAWRQRGSQHRREGAATADSDRFEGITRTVDDFREKVRTEMSCQGRCDFPLRCCSDGLVVG